MNRPANSTIIAIVLLGLLGLLTALWLIPRLEYYTETIELGYSTEARQNPYLAAEHYLQKLGKPSSSSDSLESMRVLPSIDTALIVDDISQVLSEDRTLELLDWIRAGGRLTMGARTLDEDDIDYLMDAVELEVYDTDCDCLYLEDQLEDIVETIFGREAAERVAEEADDLSEEINEELGEEILPEAPEEIPEDQLTYMYLAGIDEDLVLHFDPNRAIRSRYWDDSGEDTQSFTENGYEPVFWAGSDYGEHLIQFEIGAGLLTVLSDETVWYSRNLAERDHAYLLWALHRNSPEVMFVYGSQMPGIFTLLWRNAQELVISFLICLVAWLLYKGRRFGPILEQDRQHRRSLMEHQQAVGRFIWQRGQADKVIENMRESLKKDIEARYPGFDAKTPREQEELISTGPQVPAKTYWLAINPIEELNAERFTEVTAAIQFIRNRL